MRRLLLILVAVLVLVPLVCGQTSTCPDQEYPPLTGYVVNIDMAKVELGPPDPNGVQKPLLLNVVVVALGQTATDKIRACDQDGDPVLVDCEVGTLVPVAGEPEYYMWSWTPTEVGTSYHWIKTWDVRPVDDTKTTRGTMVVVAIPANQHYPSLCGGQLKSRPGPSEKIQANDHKPNY